MLIERDRHYKRKIVGGNILGNLWNVAKNAFSTFSKFSSKNLPTVRNALTPIVRSIGTKALEGASEGARAIAKSGVEQIHAQLTKPKAIPTQVKETIAEISTTPQVKQVLLQKAKEILNNNSQDNLTDNSREMLSNIIAGSGTRRPSNVSTKSRSILSNILRGSGLKRII